MTTTETAAGAIALIDGHYFAYRFFFGMPPLSGPGGRPTGVTFAFANLLRDLRADKSLSHWCLVFDSKEPSFRHQVFPEYKAHRDPMPAQLAAQLPDLDVIAKASGIPVLRTPGYEADDALATLAISAAAAGLDVRILTRDKDIDQIIGGRIRTWDPVKQELRGAEQLLADKGIRPEQVVDYLCMVGDSADNVPGVDGIGPKTAQKLLAEHGSLASILAHQEALTAKQRERFAAFLPKAELTRRLITLVTVPDLPPLDSFRIDRGFVLDAAAYESFGFNLARFQGTASKPASPADAPYRILGAGDLPGLVERLRRAGRFALDTETSGLDPQTCRLAGISVACGDDGGYGAAYIPVAGDGACVPLDEVRRVLGPLLADAAVGKFGQNIKFDHRVLGAQGLPVRGWDGDTMLASWLLDPSRESHGIDHLTSLFLGEHKIATGEVVDLASGATMDAAPVATVARYACEDAQCCWRLAALLETRLAEHGLAEVYHRQEIPIALCLAGIEDAGIAVDVRVLDAERRHLDSYLEQVLSGIRAITGPNFNPASPKQVAEFLFERLGLPVISRSKSGPSTDADVLQALRHRHELPDLLLQHRQLSKLIGSYLAKLPGHIAADGRIHSNFKQTGAETGRLASDQPNLQNIPKKTDLGRELRAAFIPSPGHVFVAADYSQIELRILAHLSGDAALKEAFARGGDIHRYVAAQVNGVAEDAVTPSQRSAAKAVNFGIIYGQTAFGLASALGIARHDAQRFIDAYFARFAGVKAYIHAVVAQASLCGYAETMGGRRRYLPQLSSGNRNERLHGERMALNSTIQGSAADLIKQAMLRCSGRLPAGARLLLQIHDELLVEAPAEQAEAAARALEDAMGGAATLSVPLLASARSGRDWLAVG